MNLRRKTLLILGLMLLGAVVVMLGLSYTVLIGSYSDFEKKSTQVAVSSAIKAINNEIVIIESKCGDWSRWDETYQFIQDEDPGYILRNLNTDSLDTIGIDVLLFINQSRNLVYATGYNRTTHQNYVLSEKDETKILSQDFLFSHDHPVSSRDGIISVDGSPLIVVSVPVLKSTYEGPPVGFLIFGKYMSESEVHALSEVISLNLTIQPEFFFNPQDYRRSFLDPVVIFQNNSLPVVTQITGPDTIIGYTKLPGIIGNDTFLLQVTSDREIYNQGIQTIGSFITLLIIIGLFFIAIALISIDRLVLRRLAILIDRARNRDATPDITDNQFFNNGDELSELSRSLTPFFDDYSRSIQELRESEQKHRELANIVQHTQTGIITGTLDVTDVINPAYALMHGYNPEDIVDIPYHSLFSPALRKEFPEYLKKAKMQGHVVFEAEHVHRDGSHFPTLNDLTVISDSDGVMRYWILNVQDITEHRLAWKILMESESLRESQRQLRDVISRLPDATFVIDKDGWVILWNSAMEKLTGIMADSIIGRGKNEYAIPFYGEKRPILIDLIIDPSIDPTCYYQDISRHGDTLSVEEFLFNAIHEPLYLSSVASPLYDSKGCLIGAIESIRDISSRKRVEDALLKTNEKLNLLSSITRHDIRNRITVFFGILPLLSKLSGDPEIISLVQMLEKAAGAIRDQIEFTRDYQDMGAHAPEWCDGGAIFDKIVNQDLHPDVLIENHLHGLSIYADPLLERVFYNLIDNAIRHGETVSLITASYASLDTEFVISFEDNGIGIPDDLKDTVFERGFGKNTGLGLFLVRQILSITGISVREVGVCGSGARFEMIVPQGCYRFDR